MRYVALGVVDARVVDSWLEHAVGAPTKFDVRHQGAFGCQLDCAREGGGYSRIIDYKYSNK